MLIKSEPLQDAIAAVMRILTVALVVGVAIRRIWAIAGAMAEAIVPIRRKANHEENTQESSQETSEEVSSEGDTAEQV